MSTAGSHCQRSSWPVSRILYPCQTRAVVIYLGEPLLIRSRDLPECQSGRATPMSLPNRYDCVLRQSNDSASHPLCLTLLPVGFTEPVAFLLLLVVSYTTVSPSPAKSPSSSRQYTSLLHFPSGYPARPLTGTVLYGVRTFLDLAYQAATTRPA